MPAVIEVTCTADDCEIDMFEMHYTYDMPTDTPLSEFACPYCERSESLEEIDV
ncbi:MAG: hypothetical protein ABEH56_00805 [Salinirussus sp.]